MGLVDLTLTDLALLVKAGLKLRSEVIGSLKSTWSSRLRDV